MQLNPNLTSEKGETLLACAAQNGFIEIVQLLLDAGADMNEASTIDGSTALHLAARGGYESIVEMLLQHSANIDAKDSSGRKAVDTVPAPMKHLKSLLGQDDALPSNAQPAMDEANASMQLPPGEWSTEVAVELVRNSSSCDIDVEAAENFTLTRFIERYYQQKPVVVRAAALENHGPFFSPNEFAAHFGKHLVKASVLPYGETYGVESRLVTIDDFLHNSGMLKISSASDKSADSRKPDYIFDDEVLKRKPKLLEGLRAKAPVAATKAVSYTCNNVKQQLIVGPARSAAHMHYHQDACVFNRTLAHNN
jgi:hypothetical protein